LHVKAVVDDRQLLLHKDVNTVVHHTWACTRDANGFKLKKILLGPYCVMGTDYLGKKSLVANFFPAQLNT